MRSPGFGVREHLGADEADRLGRLREVHGDEVGLGDERLDRRHELHTELAGPIGAHERVVRDEPHAERVGTLRDEHADAPEADDAERLVVELDAFPRLRFQRPATRSACACGMLRACASSSASECSAAESTFDCGALTTITPRRVASATSTLSSPMPARPTTTRSGAAASTSASTWVALRITNAATPGQHRDELLLREPDLLVDLEAGGAHQLETARGDRFGDEDAVRRSAAR